MMAAVDPDRAAQLEGTREYEQHDRGEIGEFDRGDAVGARLEAGETAALGHWTHMIYFLPAGPSDRADPYL